MNNSTSNQTENKKRQDVKVERRQEVFAAKASTRIWQETPSKNNPYLNLSSSCHGYDLLELLNKRSYIDVLYLLFRGELPNKDEKELFEQLMIAFINPGPRHPAVRAAMNAGVANTLSVHILPIGLSILGGDHRGAGAIEPSMRWLKKSLKHSPRSLAEEFHPQQKKLTGSIPGFGAIFNGVDPFAGKIANALCELAGAGEALHWGKELSKCLAKYNKGWLTTGVVAATLCDLGFQPRVGPGLFQIISAPGIFAHGIEMANKPFTAMPFLDDKDYIIEE